MADLVLAFVTGLTTGGLSCLAVQGGLLASSLANQIENDLKAPRQPVSRKKNLKENFPHRQQAKKKKGMAQPIAIFLVAKVLAYTFLGFLLGLVGSMFQLSPIARAVLQIAIGIFMLGSALRMLNVHPIFRYFTFEPPAFIRRHIRRTAANGDSMATPAFLGLMTVLIPCGITQAMMAVALGTGDPLQGAALMFAFTLGTSPVFFAVAYFATSLGSRLEKNFMRFVAVVVLVLGIFAIDTGLTLAGSPVSLSRFFGGLSGESAEAAQLDAPENTALQGGSPQDGNVVTINVMNRGYEPRLVHARAGAPIKLRLVSKNVRSCALAFVIPSLGVEEYLESTGETYIEIPPQEQGKEVPFSCSMGMYTGSIVFDL